MPKYNKIRWRESDLKELSRVVRNYNAKIKRLKQKDPLKYKNTLPQFYDSKTDSYSEKITVRQMKELINTRQDLNRELNALKRFSKKGAEEIVVVPDTDYNLKITKWQKTEMNRRIGVINRRRAQRLKEIQEMEMKSRGEELGYTREEFGMGKQYEKELRPMNAFTRRMDQSDLKWKWRSIRNESQSDYFTKRDYQVRENYIKGLKENYNYNDIKDVVEEIEKMDIKEFFKIFNEDGGTFEFASPDGQLDLKYDEYKGYASALRATWLPNRGENVTPAYLNQKNYKR